MADGHKERRRGWTEAVRARVRQYEEDWHRLPQYDGEKRSHSEAEEPQHPPSADKPGSGTPGNPKSRV